MARIEAFCIDRWEAHLVWRDEAGQVHPHPHNQRPKKRIRYEARSAPGVFPQGYLSRDEAGAACHEASKRLCTFDEWRRACQGKTKRHYPYGTQYEEGRCNVGKEHLLRKLYGEDSSRWGYDSQFNSPQLNLAPGFLARAGQHDRCVTEEGVYDLAGNLQEWISANADYRFVRRLLRDYVEREDQPLKVGNGVFVGGFYSTLREHGPGCLYATVAHEASYHDYSTGFRCCANPDGG
jgi:formylglycine-generating enzyme required for sulfatase activity